MIKVLVVDDEKWVRRGIIEKADWRNLGAFNVAEARNGVDGLEKIREYQPDIVITDMKMPVMDGKIFLTRLHDEFPDIKTIVISGYSDYEYTRQAMVNDAVDYILKPIDKEELNRVLYKAVNEINNAAVKKMEILKLKHEMNKNLPVIKEKALNSLIDEDGKNIAAKLDELSALGIDLDVENFFIAAILVCNYEEVLNGGFTGNTRRLDPEIIKVMEEAMAGNKAAAFKRSGSENLFTVLIGSNESRNDVCEADMLTRKFDKAAFSLKGSLGMKIKVGISFKWQKSCNIGRAFKEAVSAINSFNMLSDRTVMFAEQPKPNSKVLYIPEEASKDLVRFVLAGDSGKVRAQLESILDLLRSGGDLPCQDSHKICIKLLSKIEDELAAVKITFEDIFGENMLEEIKRIRSFHSVDEIERWLRETTLSAAAFVRTHSAAGSKEIVEMAVQYISDHYNEKIKLGTIAEKFYISETYFCKIFKKETGKNFLDYLTSLRLEKARNLLEKHNLKVYEVAGMVGYEDARHFSRLYRKFFSYKPSDIR